MKNTIKNFLTFGLYNRVCEAEKQSQSYYSELKRSIENIDVDSQVEEEINSRNILTEDNFSPCNYDLVSSDDYDFGEFVSEDDVAREVEVRIDEYKSEMFDDVKKQIEQAQGLVIIQTVKQVCTEMLVNWCKRTAEAANKQEETDSSSDNGQTS